MGESTKETITIQKYNTSKYNIILQKVCEEVESKILIYSGAKPVLKSIHGFFFF